MPDVSGGCVPGVSAAADQVDFEMPRTSWSFDMR